MIYRKHFLRVAVSGSLSLWRLPRGVAAFAIKAPISFSYGGLKNQSRSSC